MDAPFSAVPVTACASRCRSARAWPLAWQGVAGMGRVPRDGCAAMLHAGACRLQPVASVTVLADRGVRDRDWAQPWCMFGWHSSMRIAHHPPVTLPGVTPDARVRVRCHASTAPLRDAGSLLA